MAVSDAKFESFIKLCESLYFSILSLKIGKDEIFILRTIEAKTKYYFTIVSAHCN